jgi:hypothetical protein
VEIRQHRRPVNCRNIRPAFPNAPADRSVIQFIVLRDWSRAKKC